MLCLNPYHKSIVVSCFINIQVRDPIFVEDLISFKAWNSIWNEAEYHFIGSADPRVSFPACYQARLLTPEGFAFWQQVLTFKMEYDYNEY